jgi:small subunit ribosomal protein S2
MKRILIVSRKENGHEPAAKFAKEIGAHVISGRFMPGSLTNPSYKHFFEPEVTIVVDPSADKQAIKESVTMRIPIIGLADILNNTFYIDLILPCNNKGKKSVALILWLLAKLIKEKRNESSTLRPSSSATLKLSGISASLFHSFLV